MRMIRLSLMSALISALMLTASMAVSLAADYEEGIQAYNKGDYKTAFETWQTLAKAGHSDAQNRLGAMFLQGQVVPQNISWAVELFYLAAIQGNASAQNNLGAVYGRGLGVKQDSLRAQMWLILAAMNGLEDAAKTINSADNPLTPAQRNEAEAMAKTCIESNYKDC